MSQDLPCSRVMGASGLEERRMTWCTHHAYRTSLCYYLGLLQLVKSRFSDVVCPKKEVSYLYEYTLVDFFHHIGHHSPDLKPIENLWDVLEKTLRSDRTLPSSLQDLGEKLMQLWIEKNVVALQKLIETMPQIMCAVIEILKCVTFFFFGMSSVSMSVQELFSSWNYIQDRYAEMQTFSAA